jgi:hypothetical protein
MRPTATTSVEELLRCIGRYRSQESAREGLSLLTRAIYLGQERVENAQQKEHLQHQCGGRTSRGNILKPQPHPSTQLNHSQHSFDIFVLHTPVCACLNRCSCGRARRRRLLRGAPAPVRLQRAEGTYLSSSGCERRILLALGMGKRAQLLPGCVIRHTSCVCLFLSYYIVST